METFNWVKIKLMAKEYLKTLNCVKKKWALTCVKVLPTNYSFTNDIFNVYVQIEFGQQRLICPKT